MRITISTIIVFLLVTVTIILAGCSATGGREIFDRSGRQVVINYPINRIISTAPSNTEIIVYLGMAHKLVAIDLHSANVEGIPAGLVKLDFFFPDAEVIISLEPDIIIASGHNPTGSGADPFRLLSEAGIPVVYIPMSNSIDDIYRDIAFIADILQVHEKGEMVINTMRAQIAEISQLAVQAMAYNAEKKTVYFEISAAPQMMTFGQNSFLHDMISVIGARNIFENENWLVTPGAEAVISRNPDVILTNVNWIDNPIGEIKGRLGFNHINAVINNRVYEIDTDSSVRHSPRIVYALRQMVYAVHQLYE